MKNEPEFFPIQSLTFDPELQVRIKINEDTIADYAERMETEEDMKAFPPVEIFYDGARYWLADGHHRRAAAEMAGHGKVWAIIKSGTRADAVWAAILGNGKQGFGLTRAGKQRAIILALTHWPNKTNPVIADAVGSSRDTVRRVRDSISVGANAPTETRTGKDGKQYKAKTSKPSAPEIPEPKFEADPAEETHSEVSPLFSNEKPGFEPGPPEEEKYSSKTQLKPIPRNRPDILVSNLIMFFPEEFVPNVAREVFKQLHARYGKEITKPLATEIYKAYGKK